MSGEAKASPGVNGDGFDPRAPLDPARALVPAVVRLNERIVTRGLWPKLKRFAGRVPFAPDALAVWYAARDPETPRAAKAMVLAALAYFVLPTDAIPDFLPAIGFTDDAAVIAAVMAIVGRYVLPRHREAARAALERLSAES
ncbi:MAG TPA: YkvA family protein [Caulobacteraceae bacterium]|nr:YkvA family protein [Caulobacteraceae bacterium]